MTSIQALQKKLGVKFRHPELLELAMIHRSHLNENRNLHEHNERLEFLGDAVLELVVTEYLYINYPNPEGELTNWRSALVRGEHLSVLARNLELGKYLKLSRGEERSGGREKSYILANAFEAVVGAIYLEKGYKVAQKFIDKQVLVHLAEILEKGLHIDAKSLFQELAQAKIEVTPEYRLLATSGPDHHKTFTMGVYLGGKHIASGKGSNKQAAEQEAAREALKKKGWV